MSGLGIAGFRLALDLGCSPLYLPLMLVLAPFSGVRDGLGVPSPEASYTSVRGRVEDLISSRVHSISYRWFIIVPSAHCCRLTEAIFPSDPRGLIYERTRPGGGFNIFKSPLHIISLVYYSAVCALLQTN